MNILRNDRFWMGFATGFAVTALLLTLLGVP